MSAQKGRILVVDDEQGIRELLISEFSKLGYGVFFAVNGEDAISKLQSEKADLIITDMKMPKVDGMDLLKYVKENSPESEVIIITGYATVENALEAMHRGAYDFVQKPFNIDELAELAGKAMEKTELKTLVSLYEDANRLFSHLNLKDLLSAITSVAKKITRCAEVCVFLTNDEERLYLASSLSRYDLRKKELSELPVHSFFSGPTDCCDDQKKEVSQFVSEIYLNDAKRAVPVLFDADFASEQHKNMFVAELDIKSVLLYPIALNGKITGYIFMAKDSRSSSFVVSDLKKVSALVLQISQAVYNAREFERLESNVLKRENSADALKSLPNDSL